MIFDDITGVVGQARGWVEQQWTQRIVQISVYTSILFFVLSSFDLINATDKQVLKMLGTKLGKDGARILHAVTFGFFVYIGVKFILDPFVHRYVNGQVVEGQPPEGEVEDEVAIEGGDSSGGAEDEEPAGPPGVDTVITDTAVWTPGGPAVDSPMAGFLGHTHA